MTTFVDTSAFYAVICADDHNYEAAKTVWIDLLNRGEDLVCTNYILLETLALIQNRLGMQAARVFWEDVIPVLIVEWVNEDLHKAAMAAFLTAGRRRLSLVDCVSFEIIRKFGGITAFAFDTHFREQDFNCIP